MAEAQTTKNSDQTHLRPEDFEAGLSLSSRYFGLVNEAMLSKAPCGIGVKTFLQTTFPSREGRALENFDDFTEWFAEVTETAEEGIKTFDERPTVKLGNIDDLEILKVHVLVNRQDNDDEELIVASLLKTREKKSQPFWFLFTERSFQEGTKEFNLSRRILGQAGNMPKNDYLLVFGRMLCFLEDFFATCYAVHDQSICRTVFYRVEAYIDVELADFYRRICGAMNCDWKNFAFLYDKTYEENQEHPVEVQRLRDYGQHWEKKCRRAQIANGFLVTIDLVLLLLFLIAARIIV